MPFLGSLCDRALNDNETVPVSEVFTIYSELVRPLKLVSRLQYWEKGEICQFQNMVYEFKTKSVEVFGQYCKKIW